MTTKEMQEAILKWKKEQDCCILAHCYQTHDILEVADFVGDSFGLAQKAAQTNCKRVMMCGVRFMAETVKILSPEKQVYLPKADERNLSGTLCGCLYQYDCCTKNTV